ncbi:hypothetical protein RvY_14253 [Ramazzottius varieornatus]|uniref:Otopetrin n=1 Tax=Ramazzottius varieornatus TaxID=947166 RepID=A0A1D1VXY3_RAMVA|nr:hypothetical protein RvY_14253 [Ramazzottius varieornatus]
MFQCEFYPRQYYYGTSVYLPRASSSHAYDLESAYERGRESANMGNDRRFDLIRRFGSETTLSARSLVFSPPTERRRAITPLTGYSGNVYTDLRSSNDEKTVPPFLSHFRSLAGDLDADAASVVVGDYDNREMGVVRATSRAMMQKAIIPRTSIKDRNGRIPRSNSRTTRLAITGNPNGISSDSPKLEHESRKGNAETGEQPDVFNRSPKQLTTTIVSAIDKPTPVTKSADTEVAIPIKQALSSIYTVPHTHHILPVHFASQTKLEKLKDPAYANLAISTTTAKISSEENNHDERQSGGGGGGEPPAGKRRQSLFEQAAETSELIFDELSRNLSALYGLLMTVTSCCLSIASALTHNMDANISRWFYAGMLAVSNIWLIFAFVYLLRRPMTPAARAALVFHRSVSTDTLGSTRPHVHRYIENDVDSGSFYLKMGASLFGIGSMIYACLEIGVFVENTSCFNPVMALNPCLFIMFVMLQLYFIYKNSLLKITKSRAISRFGLMHLVATNLCVWIRTLLDETLQEFTLLKKTALRHGDLNATEAAAEYDGIVEEYDIGGEYETEAPVSSASGYAPLCLAEDSIMRKMMDQASIFLYPCIIEYALISAGIIYIMWQAVEKHNNHFDHHPHHRNPRAFSVDCSHAAKGLFSGIMVIVPTVVGLIVFFLYVDNDKLAEDAAGFVGDVMDIILNIMALLSVIFCAVQFIKKLPRVEIHTANMALDDGLLLLTMIGVYAYSVVSIVGTIGQADGHSILSVVNDFLEIIQTTIQTVFIFDAGKRVLAVATESKTPNLPDGEKPKSDKPARETLTFLLAVNFAQWALDIFCTLRADTNPGARNFFGGRQWAVLLHLTVPLVIFYRFHSTVCLFDIWKHAYKVHRPHHHGHNAHAHPSSAAGHATPHSGSVISLH